MIVVCSQCQSRYQLADERIKDKGTKVRCPRCQNTFRVFPPGLEPAPTIEEEDSDRTEFFRPQMSVSTKTATTKKISEADRPFRNEDEISTKKQPAAQGFDQPTRTWNTGLKPNEQQQQQRQDTRTPTTKAAVPSPDREPPTATPTQRAATRPFGKDRERTRDFQKPVEKKEKPLEFDESIPAEPGFSKMAPTRVSQKREESPFRKPPKIEMEDEEVTTTRSRAESFEVEEELSEPAATDNEKTQAAERARQAFPSLGKWLHKLTGKGETTTRKVPSELSSEIPDDEISFETLKKPEVEVEDLEESETPLSPPPKIESEIKSKKVKPSIQKSSVTREEKKKKEEEVDEEIRAFGSETFLEIQRHAKPKQKFSFRKIASFLVITTAVASGVFFGLDYWKKHRNSSSPFVEAPSEIESEVPAMRTPSAPPPTTTTVPPKPEPPVIPVVPPPPPPPVPPSPEKMTVQRAFEPVLRPRNWYKQEPAALQDFLGQSATLPPDEKQKPQIRAAIAEALILNGLYTGKQDQAVTGLTYASSLLAANPVAPYGFYGVTAFAVWKNELSSLQDLVKRWPESNHKDPEYRLAHLIVEGKLKMNHSGAIDEAKALLTEIPDYPAAVAWGYYLVLDMKLKEMGQYLKDPIVQNWHKAFVKHFELIRKTYKTVPTLYDDVERKIAFLSKNPKLAPLFNLKSPGGGAAVATAPTTTAPRGKEAVEKDPTKLPKASSSMIAVNKEITVAKRAAQRLLSDGIAKQKENKIDEAIQSYQRALQLDPDLADVYKRLGMIYMGRKEKERALRSFKLYLQLKPDGADKAVVQNWIDSLQ